MGLGKGEKWGRDWEGRMGKGVGRGREMEEWREGRRLGGQGNGGDGEKERTSCDGDCFQALSYMLPKNSTVSVFYIKICIISHYTTYLWKFCALRQFR